MICWAMMTLGGGEIEYKSETNHQIHCSRGSLRNPRLAGCDPSIHPSCFFVIRTITHLKLRTRKTSALECLDQQQKIYCMSTNNIHSIHILDVYLFYQLLTFPKNRPHVCQPWLFFRQMGPKSSNVCITFCQLVSLESLEVYWKELAKFRSSYSEAAGSDNSTEKGSKMGISKISGPKVFFHKMDVEIVSGSFFEPVSPVITVITYYFWHTKFVNEPHMLVPIGFWVLKIHFWFLQHFFTKKKAVKLQQLFWQISTLKNNKHPTWPSASHIPAFWWVSWRGDQRVSSQKMGWKNFWLQKM